MDRDRLKEVRQTDITESSINEDFVEWLKTKGWSWLFTVILCLLVYLAVVKWKQHRFQHVNSAWNELRTARLPGQYEDVAAQYDDLEGLSLWARLTAGDLCLQTVQSGTELDTGVVTGGETPPGAGEPAEEPEAQPLTPERREEYLNRAQRLYDAVIAQDDQSLARTLPVVNAMSGLAAVAESRGQIDDARSWYERAAARAEMYHENLAEQLSRRIASLDEQMRIAALPTEEEIRNMMVIETGDTRPATVTSSLRDLLLKSPLEDT